MILLMPGIVAASATRVLGSYLFSQGKIISHHTRDGDCARSGRAAGSLVFVPLWNVNGAAAMSSVSYVCALIATLYWYRKVSGGSIREGADLAPQRPQALSAHLAPDP